MNTFSEIEAAVAALPPRKKRELFVFLAGQLERATPSRAKRRQGFKAAARPALEGLPPDLSVGTRDRVRALIGRRNGANR